MTAIFIFFILFPSIIISGSVSSFLDAGFCGDNNLFFSIYSNVSLQFVFPNLHSYIFSNSHRSIYSIKKKVRCLYYFNFDMSALSSEQ